MKILHILPSISKLYGGPTTSIFSYTKNLRDLGVKAEILTTDMNILNNSNKSKKFQIINDVPVHITKNINFPVKKIYEFGMSPDIFFWIRENIRNYDLIHIYGLFRFPSTLAMIYSIKFRVPFVFYACGGFDNANFKNNGWLKKTYLNFFDKRNLEKSALFHFNSIKERNEAQKQSIKFKSFVLPVGVEVPPLEIVKNKSKADKKINFIFLSRIHPIKRLDIFLEAMGILNKTKNIKEWELHIAGEGDLDYKKYLFNIIKKENLQENIKWHGFLENDPKNRLLRKCDWLVSTSKSESLGISIIEALAQGLPVMITKGIAISNKLSKKKAGYIVSENPKLLATQIKEKYLRKPTKVEILNAYNFALENYCEKKLAYKLLKKYKELI